MRPERPTLFLFPNVLGEEASFLSSFPPDLAEDVTTLDGLIAESAQGGRRFLSRFVGMERALRIPIAVVDRKTAARDLDFYLDPLLRGQSWGYVSDCGLPCLADPGAVLVRRARERKIEVKVFVGPSSILLGLMLSGLPAQRFSFHGYPPRNAAEKMHFFAGIEDRSRREEATELFIEAPYRNDSLLETLLKQLSPMTTLCIAWDLMLPSQQVVVQSVALWRQKALPELRDHPALFCLYAGRL